MKHYEIVFKLKANNNEIKANNNLKIIDIDNVVNKEEYMVVSDEQFPHYVNKRSIFSKIIEYALNKSTYDRAMLLVDFSKNSIKFIARIREDYKNNIEYLIKMVAKYINENIEIGDEDEHYIIDDEPYYTEISAKEFLIVMKK